MALVAGRRRDGYAPLRHPGARSGGQLRRRAAGLQHGARQWPAPANDAVPLDVPSRARGHRRAGGAYQCEPAAAGGHAGALSMRRGRSASGACRTAPRLRKPRWKTSSTPRSGLYAKEVDQRDWYGFWNYGDIMHSHDGRATNGGTTRVVSPGTTPNSAAHVVLVHLPAHRPRRRCSAWPRP